MARLTAAESRIRFDKAKRALQKIYNRWESGNHDAFQPREIFDPADGTWRFKVLNRLIDMSILMSTHEGYTVRDPDGLKELLDNNEAVSELIWPKPRLVVRASETLSEPEAPADEPLQPPPPIEGLQQPPPGASDEVVKQWIFTLLHAQTENLIYIREKVDAMWKILEQLK